MCSHGWEPFVLMVTLPNPLKVSKECGFLFMSVSWEQLTIQLRGVYGVPADQTLSSFYLHVPLLGSNSFDHPPLEPHFADGGSEGQRS